MNSYVVMVDIAFLPVLLITCPCASSRNTNRLLNNKQCARPLCEWWQKLICCWQAVVPSFLHYSVCGYVILWTRAAVFEEFEVSLWFIGLWNFRFCIRLSFDIPSCGQQICWEKNSWQFFNKILSYTISYWRDWWIEGIVVYFLVLGF